jgi:hypothetical protein
MSNTRRSNDYDDYADEPFTQAINACNHLGMRPDCHCCGGGEVRGKYTMTKAKSARKSRNARKPEHIDKRARRNARPDKFGSVDDE